MFNLSRRTLRILFLMGFIVCLETTAYIFCKTPTQASNGQSAMATKEAMDYMQNQPNLVLVDVRSNKEFSGTHLAGALNIPLYSFSRYVDKIPRNQPVLLYCMHGYRAFQAYKLLKRLRPDLTEVHYAAGRLLDTPQY